MLVDVPLAHLDRPFDYAVPETMSEDAQPGVRVKVRFAGQDVDGFVLERAATTEHTGRLQPLRRVVSPEPVLAPDVADLTAAVAARYAGTRSDVLRLAVPPGTRPTEKQPLRPAPPRRRDADVLSGVGLRAARRSSRRWPEGTHRGPSWTVPPGRRLGLAAGRGGGGDRRQRSWRPGLRARPSRRRPARRGPDRPARRRSPCRARAPTPGPAKRYAAFLAVTSRRGRVAIGTRAAAFAPVHDLGLVAIWDDGDDLHDEPRAPYPHAREVLLLRAQQTGCAAVLAAHARSVEAEYLVRTGWATEVQAPRATWCASGSRWP